MGHRTARLAGEILRNVSEILRLEVRDPRVGFVTVSRVDLSEDGSFAKILVSVMGSDEERAETMKGLKKCAPFVRGKLARMLTTRTVPEIVFAEDRNLDHAYRIQSILAGIHDPELPPEEPKPGEGAAPAEDSAPRG
ncbi:MAG: 30S ribosome-binding factor RbfA [Fibrobacterales bacterium]|nr:30S ribosome-binding factor RbfA [Fibrobacterales bacterium]